ncbi:Cof-type HAD-IIB family hydrolase [Macrococcoides caseolyticum]|uniref:Cof-type HAD-IIB family hydrolase n=1 Tax=Macrococcoides caseolyticum TaxID=69966 RepID=UPI000C34EF59|nr:Cof-type HAD-IIB family hydrolase [Macrococcus caseolyticus]PKE62614.1 Cof-type HAD-IIB family hydrolase [Macrococcus caseolyticus]
MKHKLILFDIDGTLYDHDKKIPNSTMAAIRALQTQGHSVAIATGRAPFMVQPVLEETRIKDYVSFNGQYVYANGNVVYENPLDTESLKALEHTAREHDHPVVFLTHDDLVANIDFHEDIETSLSTMHMAHPRKDDIFYTQHKIYQALIFHQQSEDGIYDGQFEHLKFIRWHELSRDVVPDNGSKMRGITHLAASLGFDIEDTVAFGDGLNDIEMIEGAGIGVVMGNGVDELKQYADFVTKAVDEDGIMYAVKTLNLIEG